jgi:uncharacterized protein (TIGR03663 family)
VHVDEAVHAYKLNELWQTHRYTYDPYEYHGPSLYYLTLPSTWFSGATDWRDTTIATYRIVPAIAGLLLILLLPLITDGLGRTATASAALLIAVSPAFVFYSPYYIQEMLLVLATFLTLAAAWRFIRSHRIAWALLAGVGAGLMHATKETSIIAFGCAVGAATLTGYGSRHDPTPTPRSPSRRTGIAPPAIAALLVAAAVSITLYSGLFTNARGPLDSILTYATYFERAGEGGVHEHPWHYYLHLLLYAHFAPGPTWSEAFIFLLGVAGIVATLARRTPHAGHPALLRFLILYTLAMTLAYSAIPYKTPWCALSFLHGWILLAGVGTAALIRWSARHAAALAGVLTFLAFGTTHLGVQAWRQSTRFCADARNPYCYAHTTHQVDTVVHYIDQLRALHPAESDPLIKVCAPNVWPLPWYLRDYTRVGWWETLPDDPDADILIASHTLEEALDARLRQPYAKNYYGVRRDDPFILYVSRPLRDAFVAAQPEPP